MSVIVANASLLDLCNSIKIVVEEACILCSALKNMLIWKVLLSCKILVTPYHIVVEYPCI